MGNGNRVAVPSIAVGGSGGAMVTPLPFVEEHEEADAKKLIDSLFMEMIGRPCDLRPAGYLIAVKIHVRSSELIIKKKEDGSVVLGPNGAPMKLWLPEVSLREDKYSSVSALVCAIGPQAYKGTNADGSPRFPEGPWARTGDFVCIPRHESFLCSFSGPLGEVAMAILPDDKIIAVLKDPEDVKPVYVAPRV